MSRPGLTGTLSILVLLAAACRGEEGGAGPATGIARRAAHGPAGWSAAAGAVSPARTGMSAHRTVAVLADGRVLLPGGRAGTGASAAVTVFMDAFGLTGGAPLAVASCSGMVVAAGDGSRAFVFGGASNEQCTGTPIGAIQIHTGDAGFTDPDDTLSVARFGGTATVLQDGRILIAGGSGPTGPTAASDVYNPATEDIAAVEALDEARQGHVASILPDGRVLVAGGFSFSGGFPPTPIVRASTEIFAPATSLWSDGPNMSTARIGHAVARLGDGRVLICGGYASTPPSGDALRSCELFDPDDNTFSPAASLASGRSGHAMITVTDGGALAVGGNTNATTDTTLATSERYDPDGDAWSGAGSMAETRTLHAIALVPEGHVLAAGGQAATSPTAALRGTGDVYDAGTPESCEVTQADGTTITIADGTDCDDGDACTSGDACAGGACAGSARDCDDGDACTTDSCDAGTGDCVHDPVVCADDGNDCTDDVCDSGTGACTHPDLADGTACDDGDACTEDDECAAGACAGADIDCSDLDTVCAVGTCDAGTGACEATAANEGGGCDDGDVCTENDRCTAGECAGTALDCDDGDPCTTDSCVLTGGVPSCTSEPRICPDTDGSACTDRCNPASGACEAVAIGDGEPCSDGNQCTVGDVCVGGSCIAGRARDCDDGNRCTTDSCIPATGCANTAVSCTHDGNSCHRRDCNPATGRCNDPVADGAACDTLVCRNGETCQSGTCAGGTAVSCADDGNACTSEACSEPGGCASTPVAGRPCDDGDACTANDDCDGAGGCAGTALDCDDDDACTGDSCDPANGCEHDPVVCPEDADPCTRALCRDQGGVAVCTQDPVDDGGACDDGDPCTEGDACTAGDCAGSPLDCDDDDACTDDACVAGACTHDLVVCPDDGNRCTRETCNPATGACGSSPISEGGACDDGDPCTEGEVCTAGVCGRGGPTECEDDGNPCTVETCVAGLGCRSVNLPNGTGCNDGDACTAGDACSAGACRGTRRDCGDGDACTTDGCDPATGACSNDPLVCNDTDGDPCTDACNPAIGACERIAAAEGAACDDGDECSEGETCTAGVCAGGLEAECPDDGNACTFETCVAGLGCRSVDLPDGTPCNDGLSCTEDDACADGECAGEDTCDDRDPCTDDRCDPDTGACTAGPRACPDTDSNPCTDACDPETGTCEVVAVVCASDGDPCTVEFCTRALGCRSAPLRDGDRCDDGDPCTESETCNGGACGDGVPVEGCVPPDAGGDGPPADGGVREDGGEGEAEGEGKVEVADGSAGADGPGGEGGMIPIPAAPGGCCRVAGESAARQGLWAAPALAALAAWRRRRRVRR